MDKQEYYIRFQITPWNSHEPETMIVRANDRVDAFLTAINALTTRGIICSTSTGELGFSRAERERVVSAGLPKPAGNMVAFIRLIKEYGVPVCGELVRG